MLGPSKDHSTNRKRSRTHYSLLYDKTGTGRPTEEVNSAAIAGSVNTSPSFVRRVLAKLSGAGLVETATGKNGACWLARPPRDISLLEIYRAVEVPKAFAIHQYPVEKRCTVSCHIKSALGRVLDEAQQALEQRLSRISLAQVIADLHKK